MNLIGKEKLYTIRQVGKYYEAITSEGILRFGGEHNAGAVDGSNAKDVIQAVLATIEEIVTV